MARFTSEILLANPPVEVECLGFRSNTRSLGLAGWRMAVAQNDYRDAFNVLFQHKVGVKMSGVLQGGHFADERHRLIIINNIFSHDVVIQQVRDFSARPYDEVSLMPEYIHYDEVRPFDCAFRPIDAPVKQEIIVDEPTVMELYDRILKLQTPKQAEIRERRRRETPRVEAQILSFGTMSP